mgnify:CR=1 FL=1
MDGLSDTFVRNFNADLKAQTDAFLKATMAEMEKQSANITAAILQDKTLSTLDAADSKRDEAIKTLGTVLAAYAVFPIAEKKELAAPLKAVWDKYAKAGITTANYTSESSMVESMLGDLGTDSLAENIKGLEGVAEAIAAVRLAQDEFTKANDDYVKASANKSASASTYKKPIISLINDKLVPYLDAMVIAGNENCLEFAKGVVAEIERANDMIAKRGSKKGAGSVANE